MRARETSSRRCTQIELKNAADPNATIFVDRKARGDESKAVFVTDSIAFFEQPLPGRDTPLGDPGGAGTVGDLGVDTPMVAQYRPVSDR